MHNKADNRSAIEKTVARLKQNPRQIETVQTEPSSVAESLPIQKPDEKRQPRKPIGPAPPGVKKQVVARENPGLASLAVEGLISLENPDPQTIAEFRRIKRPLLAKAFGKGPERIDRGNLIMVTSALPGEGKSSTAINLARSIAMERNHTVLLIDADITVSRLSRMYSLQGTPGLTDLLLDNTLDPREVMARTDFPDLVILPAGRRHEHATELISSNEMERLLNEIASRYVNRVVVFDSPPLLATAEAPVLAKHVGQIVFVVEADRTRQHVVQNALAELDQSKEIGIVLNKCRSKHNAKGYYGYGYGHEYGE